MVTELGFEIPADVQKASALTDYAFASWVSGIVTAPVEP